MLKLDLRVGEAVDIDNGRCVVRVEAKSGQRTRLAFSADSTIQIRKVAATDTHATPGRRRLTPVE